MKSILAARRLLSLCLAALLLSGIPSASAAQTEPDIHAESAIVMDYDTGETIYEKKADELMVPASMTKIMTAYLIFEELEAGRLTLDTMVPISRENAQKPRDPDIPAMVPLTAGEEVSVDTLLKLILLPSASASCIVMAEYISGSEEAFVARMNETARRLGMVGEYENCHGAFPHYLTARSVAILIREFIDRFPQILAYTSLPSVEFDGRTYTNTNKLLSDYRYEGCDGFKTGTIPEAGYCLSATALRDGRRIITVIMKSDNDAHRHTDTAALLDYGFAWLEQNSFYFDDIAGHWARSSIETLADTGVALHARGGEFRPQDPITRAEFTAMLISALGPRGALDGLAPGEAPEFSDLEDCWAQAEILRAASLGLVSGIGQGEFGPDSAVTREQAMVILDGALSLPQAESPVFADSAAISLWAQEAAARAVAAGLFSGDGAGYLRPQGQLTRAEAAAVFVQILERL